MAYSHITASGAATLHAGNVYKAKVQVNAALTGTITVSDGATVVGIITNPTVGTLYEYWDLQTSLIVNPSATCEITVSWDSSNRAR